MTMSEAHGRGSRVEGLNGQWIQPQVTDSVYRTGLFVNNSMAGGKVEFIPSSGGRHITWYGCGPTVYDAAHLGHARTYLSFDTIRRVLNEYFGYHVTMCMNITDIDDKIILRSTEQKMNFAHLARYWEAMFWKDMIALGVELPDVITRVSEYIPQVIEFIEKIIQNGFAYVSEGSVYFDIQAFRSSPPHVYGRMEPSSVNDEARILEGEGALTLQNQKRGQIDFALWKKTKQGEPFWDSPWGPGRPGWHIECSAMASTIFDFPIDIHSGGIDLRFPHHDNELAQSEAHYNRPQWVNYFLHSGHLHIKGSKMSKSEKNFITIQECLKSCSARILRLYVLSHRWDAPMNYSPQDICFSESRELDKTFLNVFARVADLIRESAGLEISQQALQGTVDDLHQLKGLLGTQRWEESDMAFQKEINHAQTLVDEALKDNFNTPLCLSTLKSLASRIHIYLNAYRTFPKTSLVVKAARFIFRILKIFGVTTGNITQLDYLNCYESSSSSSSLEANRCLINSLASFRYNTRLACQASLKVLKMCSSETLGDVAAISQAMKNLLSCCDNVRQDLLLNHGIQLEDGPQGFTWKQLPKENTLEDQAQIANDAAKKQNPTDSNPPSLKQHL